MIQQRERVGRRRREVERGAGVAAVEHHAQRRGVAARDQRPSADVGRRAAAGIEALCSMRGMQHRRARRRFHSLIRQRQRAIVKAPWGQKRKAQAELKSLTTELLRQHVEKAA